MSNKSKDKFLTRLCFETLHTYFGFQTRPHEHVILSGVIVLENKREKNSGKKSSGENI
jgi:hypothetical protein